MCTTGVLTISKRVITFTFIEHQTDIDIETKLFSLTKREEKKKKNTRMRNRYCSRVFFYLLEKHA